MRVLTNKIKLASHVLQAPGWSRLGSAKGSSATEIGGRYRSYRQSPDLFPNRIFPIPGDRVRREGEKGGRNFPESKVRARKTTTKIFTFILRIELLKNHKF
jgi:hypothetical protein